MQKQTYAIVRRYKNNEQTSTYNIVGEKLYYSVDLANSLCADFSNRQESQRVSYTVVIMPFNHI